MAKLSVLAGATSQSINIFIQDSSSTTGAGLSGIAPAGGSLLSGFKASYSFSGANAARVSMNTLAILATVGTAWASNSIVELDATEMKGVYRVDIPNASLATSKGRSVTFYFYGGTNVAPLAVEVELTGWDNQSVTDGGLSKLTSLTYTVANKIDANVYTWNGTAVSAPATAGIPEVNVKNINNVSASPVTTVKAVQGLAVDGVVTTVTNQLTAAQVATGVWQDATAGDFTTASSIGKSLYTGNVAPGGTNGLFIAGTNAATTITTALTTTFTGNLTGSVGSVTGAVGSVTGAVGSVTGAVGSVTGAVGSVTGNVGGNVGGSVASVTAGVTVTTNNDKTGYTASTVGDKTGYALTSGERTSIADALLDESNGVETSLTLRQATRLMLAALSGKLSGAGTTTVTIRNVGDTKNRIVATVDATGNRSAVTTDGT